MANTAGNPTYTIRVYRAADDLPVGAEELLGNNVIDEWEVASPEPACVAALDAGGGVAAAVFLLIENLAGEKVASIRQLVVSPEHWGKGLAGRLLRRTLELARETGCPRVRSTAGWGCPDQFVLYDRLGFHRAAGESPYIVSRKLAAY